MKCIDFHFMSVTAAQQQQMTSRLGLNRVHHHLFYRICPLNRVVVTKEMYLKFTEVLPISWSPLFGMVPLRVRTPLPRGE